MPDAASPEDIRLLVDGIVDYGICMLGLDGTVLTWNEGARRMQGYDAAAIIGQDFAVFYPDTDRGLGRPGLDLEHARAAGRFEDEGWRVRKGGDRFWTNVVITALYDPSGGIRGFGQITRDLTERRDAETRYRLLVDGVRDYAIITLDRAGTVLTWNAGAERIKGYRSDEIIGQNFRRFYTAADLDRDYPTFELERATEAGRYEDEGWRVRADGGTFWANVVITALRDERGDLLGFSKVTRDLTERRAAEQRLRESEERVRLMVESVRDYAIILLDPQGIIATWNAGAERIKGWTASEIIGRSFEAFYPEDDLAAGKTTRELAAATEHGSFEDFGWRVRKDGSRFWANVVITALRDETGTLRGFAKVTRDITERRNADEALRKAYEELESFSYSVSHDLRAPLRSMDGFSDELLLRYGDKLDARGKDYLQRIRGSAQRMSRLIDDLLNLSRLGRTKVEREVVDLSTMARRIGAELHRLEPARTVELVIEPKLVAHADPALIRVVLENLIGNAWKYTARHPTARIEVGRGQRAGKPTYFVRDDGAGFDMAYRAKLFGPFQRLHTDDAFAGNGIGLATVKRIIQRHGGEVFAEGEVERGATFGFTLPGSA
jgi:PAS domain S-box-containing protein